jgi:hypothetical protein
MFHQTISQGTRKVHITANSAAGPFSSRLYVNRGEIATLTAAKHKGLQGALRWARKAVDQ